MIISITLVFPTDVYGIIQALPDKSPSYVRLHCSITSKRVMCTKVLVCSCSLDIRCAIHVRLIDLTEGSRPPSNALPSYLVYSVCFTHERKV